MTHAYEGTTSTVINRQAHVELFNLAALNRHVLVATRRRGDPSATETGDHDS